MSCKSKARKKSVNRSDHKHNYVDAVIMYKVGKDDSHFYLGKVCSMCGRIDAKYTYRIDNNSLFKEIDMPKDLPIYIENENGKTAILKSN